MLAELAPQLPEPLRMMALQKALAAVWTMKDKDREARDRALVSLSPQLPEPLLREALETVRTMDDEKNPALAVGEGKDPALALRGLAPYLSEPLLREALAMAWAMDTYKRSPALEGLVLRLGALGYGEEALATARAIAWTERRVMVLAKLVPYLPDPLQTETLRETLTMAQAIEDGWSRAEVLTKLAPQLECLPTAMLYHLWCETLHILASRTRSDLLSDSTSPIFGHRDNGWEGGTGCNRAGHH